MSQTLAAPNHPPGPSVQQQGGTVVYRAASDVPGSYATLADLMLISIPVDAGRSFRTDVLLRWLTIGAAQVDEYLGQRFAVPLVRWSETVVWANCEKAYIGALRQRGVNTEADAANLAAREKAVNDWLVNSRDHAITPDPRLLVSDAQAQPLRYFGPPNRGWTSRLDDRLRRGR